MLLCLEGLALAALAAGHLAQGVRLAGAAHALRIGLALPPVPVENVGPERAIAQARRLLGERAFAQHWEAGSRLGLDAAIQEALQPEE